MLNLFFVTRVGFKVKISKSKYKCILFALTFQFNIIEFQVSKPKKKKKMKKEILQN